MDPAPPEEGAAPADPKKEADEARAKALFTQFTLAFLKASSLTGYYPPDHPSIKNIAYEPYRIIGSLREFTPEIGFVTSSGTLGDEIMIDLLAEPLPFLSLMRSAMAETFAQKFINYLERNYLVSFAIRTSIQFDEFKRFISLFVERKTKLEAGAGEGLEVPFGQLLVEHEVYNISALSRDDVLGGQRVLPWRVKIAIARLRKDLQVLPMYSKASEMEIQAAKQLIIGDIIRPLRRPRFLRELLVNADLIRGQVGELYSVDVEQAIIDCLAPGMVDLVAQDVVRVLEGASWGLVMQQDGESERRIDEILKDLLKRLALRLATLDVNQTYDLLLHLFKLRVLGFLELPPNLRRMMQAEKWTGQFLLEEEIIVARFGAMTDPATYRAYLQNIDLVLPELLRRGSIGPAARLIKVLAEHARDHGNPIRQGMAQIALLDLSSQENVDRLRPQVLQDDRQVRQVAIAILRQFSFKGAEVLLEILGESDDAAVRRDVLAALEGMGVSIRTLLEERLQVAGLPWFVYRNLLLLVGRVGCEGALEDVKRFTSHMDHRVREQALQTLYLQTAERSVPILLTALRDRDARVARRAMVLLSDLDCRHAAFLKFLAGLFQTEEQAPGREHSDVLRLRGLETIERLGDFDVDGVRVSTLLLDLVTARTEGRIRKLITRVKKADAGASEEVRGRACQVLGAIGDLAVGRALAEAPEGLPPLVEAALEEALAAINAREIPARG